MNKLNNKGGAIAYILLVLLIIAAVGLSVFVYYYKNYVYKEETNTTKVVDITNEDKAMITNYMNSCKEIISKIMYEKENDTNKLILNKNILTDIKRQLYTFLYLDKEGELQDKYIKSIVDNKEYIYLPLEEFNSVYNILFKEEFNSLNKDVSSVSNEYDKGDYIYYNKDSIIDDISIDAFTINDLIYDENNNYYNASFDISFVGKEDTNKVIVTYIYDNNDIYLKEIRIK